MTQSAERVASRVSGLYDPRRSFEVQRRDLEYRRDGDQGLLATVYQPQGPGPFPALIEVHGGAWNKGSRADNEGSSTALAASGLVVMAIDFRLAPADPYPASIADVNYATRWLKAHAPQFNASPDAVGAIGHSSGGHMVLLSAMRPHDPRYAVLPLEGAPDLDASLAYVVAGSPVACPFARYRHVRSIGRHETAETALNYFQDEATLQEASPLLILERGEPAMLPPTFVLLGSEDDVMSTRFIETYAHAGGIIEFGGYPGAGHGFTREPGSNTDRAIAAIKGFIGRQLSAIGQGW